MSEFTTLRVADAPVVTAPDGAEVRILPSLTGGSFAQFSLKAGEVSRAVKHLTVEEIWFVVAGAGEMLRRQGAREEVAALAPGVCLTIPVGAHFQFRATGPDGLAAIAVTMPPWPTDREEAVRVADHWDPNPVSPPLTDRKSE